MQRVTRAENGARWSRSMTARCRRRSPCRCCRKWRRISLRLGTALGVANGAFTADVEGMCRMRIHSACDETEDEAVLASRMPMLLIIARYCRITPRRSTGGNRGQTGRRRAAGTGAGRPGNRRTGDTKRRPVAGNLRRWSRLTADKIPAPEQPGFASALVKAKYEGEAVAFAPEKQRPDNSTALIMTQSGGERPTVINHHSRHRQRTAAPSVPMVQLRTISPGWRWR